VHVLKLLFSGQSAITLCQHTTSDTADNIYVSKFTIQRNKKYLSTSHSNFGQPIDGVGTSTELIWKELVCLALFGKRSVWSPYPDLYPGSYTRYLVRFELSTSVGHLGPNWLTFIIPCCMIGPSSTIVGWKWCVSDGCPIWSEVFCNLLSFYTGKSMYEYWHFMCQCNEKVS